jgi:phosphoribosylformylglycinamidine synthase subunit PurS
MAQSFKARITVTLKNGVLDPQGKAIEGGLKSLGIMGIDSVRQGKMFDVVLGAASESEARSLLGIACEKLLANTVVENYTVEIKGAA